MPVNNRVQVHEVQVGTYSNPRGAIRRRRNEGDIIWKKSLSGETTRTCESKTVKAEVKKLGVNKTALFQNKIIIEQVIVYQTKSYLSNQADKIIIPCRGSNKKIIFSSWKK